MESHYINKIDRTAAVTLTLKYITFSSLPLQDL